jgi:hypothetical protein
VLIELTNQEQWRAACCGLKRWIEAHTKGCRQRFGQRGDYRENVSRHIIGAMGELAAAKALRVEWPATVNEMHVGNGLPGGIEVRTGMHARSLLVVRPNTPDGVRVVWVKGHEAPLFTVTGWIVARDAKRPEFWKAPAERPPAWFVPDFVLRKIDTLAVAAAAEEVW